MTDTQVISAHEEGTTPQPRPPRSHLEWALSYAARGWRVLPLQSIRYDIYTVNSTGEEVEEYRCSCKQGAACENMGKHPSFIKGMFEHGSKDASTDIEKLKAAWKQYSDANIGVATGRESGIIAVDIDPRNGGTDTWMQLCAENGMPDTLLARTGGGGYHYIFQHPGDVEFKSDANVLGPGVDIKSGGGFIVVTPSLHKSGKCYQWENNLAPAPLPDWIRDRLEVVGTRRSKGGDNAPTGDNHPKVAALLAKLQGVQSRGGGQYQAYCPAHGDNNPSLSIAVEGEKILLYCHAGCSAEDIVTAVGMTMGDLFLAKKKRERKRKTKGEASGNSMNDAPFPFPLTELGNAERLIAAHGADLRFFINPQQWLNWTGKAWAVDETGAVSRLARRVVRKLAEEAEQVKDLSPDEQFEALKKLAYHIKRSESAAQLSAMVKLARYHAGIPVRSDELDADSWSLNVLNGTLDLRTAQLRPHAPGDLNTKLVPVAYDPNATCPRWEQFLHEVFMDDEELIAYTQRMAGYLLTGDTREHAVFFMVGKGANGKSVLLEALRNLLGDYARDTSFATFLEQRDNSTADLASLVGARLVTASEAEGKQSFAEPLLKRVSGGDTITCRFLYKEFFTYTPHFKVLFATNEMPRFSSHSYAMQRRIHIIPFRQTFYAPDEGKLPVRDERLSERLREELPGILRWAVTGCLLWRMAGLKPPEIVRQETEDLMESFDPLADFLREACIIHPHARVESGVLWRAYLSWCEDAGRTPAYRTPDKFSRNLTQRQGIEAKKSDATRYLAGIALGG